ncbi:MAG TPA: YlmH/Sll1252 family protein [Lachnospiraceae bacterium]|nr:YlmH/Sll1252 family protein [Lachnospiraceae bacterium]
MDNENEFLNKRLRELSDRSWSESRYFFSDFLNESELAEFYTIKKELSPCGTKVFGGYEGAERCIIRFGSPETLGYEEAFPIGCILVRPLIPKFSNELTHRDYLGALMNLGIERNVIGDLLVAGNECTLFCEEKLSSYLCENLTKVSHTNVRCTPAETIPVNLRLKTRLLEGQAASERLDAIISKICNLSRNESLDLCRQKKVFVNGRICEDNSCELKSQDVISVRGYGKFRYLGSHGLSRKGKMNFSYEKYI